jgi:hypothetical protein
MRVQYITNRINFLYLIYITRKLLKKKNPKMVFTNIKIVFLNEASLDLNFKRILAWESLQVSTPLEIWLHLHNSI